MLGWALSYQVLDLVLTRAQLGKYYSPPCVTNDDDTEAERGSNGPGPRAGMGRSQNSDQICLL